MPGCGLAVGYGDRRAGRRDGICGALGPERVFGAGVHELVDEGLAEPGVTEVAVSQLWPVAHTSEPGAVVVSEAAGAPVFPVFVAVAPTLEAAPLKDATVMDES